MEFLCPFSHSDNDINDKTNELPKEKIVPAIKLIIRNMLRILMNSECTLLVINMMLYA